MAIVTPVAFGITAHLDGLGKRQNLGGGAGTFKVVNVSIPVGTIVGYDGDNHQQTAGVGSRKGLCPLFDPEGCGGNDQGIHRFGKVFHLGDQGVQIPLVTFVAPEYAFGTVESRIVVYQMTTPELGVAVDRENVAVQQNLIIGGIARQDGGRDHKRQAQKQNRETGNTYLHELFHRSILLIRCG